MADEKDIESIRFIDSAGGTLRSSVYPTATCTVPQGALQNELNFIPVSIQVRVNMVNGYTFRESNSASLLFSFLSPFTERNN